MIFSKSCQYGLRATIFVAKQSALKNKVGLKVLTKAINSPEAFTAKILQLLTKNNIINSIKGPYGGFVIESHRLKEITLSDIVVALDGNKLYTACGLGLKKCNEESPCPVHFEFLKIRENLKNMLQQNTLYDIIYSKGKINDLFLKV